MQVLLSMGYVKCLTGDTMKQVERYLVTGKGYVSKISGVLEDDNEAIKRIILTLEYAKQLQTIAIGKHGINPNKGGEKDDS